MLKIKKPYKFTKEEWNHVKTVLLPYVEQNGGIKGWRKADNATLDLKNKISQYTLIKQGNKCAYCEDFMTSGIQLDHIVPKQRHSIFCYEPKNLVSVCAVCNMYIKNDDDTIEEPLKNRYEQNKFKIVHPYFNNPDIHIKYTNEDRIIIDIASCSDLGKATIDFFHLNDYPAYCKRAQRFGNVTKYPIDGVKLAKESSAYKGKK